MKDTIIIQGAGASMIRTEAAFLFKKKIRKFQDGIFWDKKAPASLENTFIYVYKFSFNYQIYFKSYSQKTKINIQF